MADISGPWDKYKTQTAPSQEGPWTKYSQRQDPPSEATSGLERFGTGIRDIAIEGPTQAIYNAFPSLERFNNYLNSLGVPVAALPEGGINEYERHREETIKSGEKAAGVDGIDWARTAGEVTAGVALTPEMKLGTVANAAIGGAIQGAATPVSDAKGESDYWSKKGAQTAIGGTAGAVGGTIAKGVGKVLTPTLGASQKALSEKGVSLTPGQIGGDTAKGVEEFLARFPIIGHFIRSAEERTLKSFNAATINQALEPIEKSLPKSVQSGHEAVSFAKDTLKKAYDETYKDASLKITPEFAKVVKDIRAAASQLPPDYFTQFDKVLTSKMGSRFVQSNVLTGGTVKDIDSDFGSIAQSYITSTVSGERELGKALKGVQGAIKDAIKTQNPSIAPKISNLDASYAMMTRVENAASRRIDAKGVFTPKDLLSAVKKADTSVRDRNFAAGDTLFQSWAEAANDVIPQPVKQSYLIGAGEIAAGEGAFGLHPVALAPLGAGVAASSALYSKPAVNLLNWAARTPPGIARETFSDVLDRAAGAPAAAVAEEEFPQ
jgi:hypothetical protein